MRFIKLEKLINLSEGYQNCFEVEGHSLLLLHHNNQSYLYLNQCPHQRKPLGKNCIKQDKIRCPWHGMEYAIHSGLSISSIGQQTPLKLTQYRVAYEHNYIGIYLQ